MDKINIKFNNPIMDQENIEKIAGKVNNIIDNGPELIAGKDIAPDDVNATGKITGDEIVENMTGYDFTPSSSDENITLEFVYAGVVKNGNKLTTVVALNITRTGDSSSHAIGQFVIPSGVLSKLYPSQIGSYNFLDVKSLAVFNTYQQSVSIHPYIQKASTYLQVEVTNLGNLTANTKYYMRYEATFLLGENLVGE